MKPLRRSSLPGQDNLRLALLCWSFFVIFCAVPGGQGQTSAREVRHAAKKVEPSQVVHLHAKGPGTVEGVSVKVGDAVKELQTLAFLDHARELHAYRVAKLRAENKGMVRSAEGELKKSHAVLDDVRGRHRRRLANDSDLLRTEADVQIAEGKLEQVKTQQEIFQLEVELTDRALQERFFVSPIAGTVLAIAKSKGEAVKVGDLVVTVADLNRLSTTLLLPEAALEKIKAGGFLPVQLANTNILRLGQIESISPVEGGNQLVRLVFPNLAPNQPPEEADYEVRLPEGVEPVSPPEESAKKP